MNDFESNKKMFWKEVKRVTKGEQARDEMIKDVRNNKNIILLSHQSIFTIRN